MSERTAHDEDCSCGDCERLIEEIASGGTRRVAFEIRSLRSEIVRLSERIESLRDEYYNDSRGG